jgi:hypothetical protein
VADRAVTARRVRPGAGARAGLRSRPAADSVEALVGPGARCRPFRHEDGKSGSTFERVRIGDDRFVLKRLHVDDDWIARSLGDLRCRSLLVWTSGLLDAVPAVVDHAVVGAAGGLGRNGWGAALLMHDVGAHLVPAGDAPLAADRHAALVEGMAELAAHLWGWSDGIGLLPLSLRYSMFGPGMLEVERDRGWPDAVPRLADEGWRRFADRVPAATSSVVTALRHEPSALAGALASTPSTFLHGDWKLGNLGTRPDGRVVLLDWAYPGEGPACHDLAWYLALNRARLPEPKEAVIARFRRGLERRGVATDPWWDRQLGLCLLGALVQFGWEKALGDDDELAWWVDAAAAGARWL